MEFMVLHAVRSSVTRFFRVLSLRIVRNLSSVFYSLLIPFLIILSLTNDAFAGAVQLPKTGQNAIFFSAGDDGDWKSGVSAAQRFTVGSGLQAECVTDNLTGLMWVKTPESVTRTWQGALDYSLTLNLCGFSDWRVPTILELESLINAGQADPAAWLNTQSFSNVQSNDYWASTTSAGSTGNALQVSMGAGHIIFGDKTELDYVWPVRGGTGGAQADVWKSGQTTSYYSEDDGELQPGVSWPLPRFTVNSTAGTVEDNLTGLIWLKNANCFGRQIWYDALTAANNLKGDNTQCFLNDGSAAGDWRLPNRKELLSLVDFGYFGPALSNTAGTGKWSAGAPFDGVQSYGYWSSTTDAGHTYNAWAVDLWYGYVGYVLKSNEGDVWPVRGGVFDRLALLTPKFGEEVLSGGVAEIKWKFQGSNIQLLNIELWKGETYLMTLALYVPVTYGAFLWNISPSTPAGTDYQIRLINAAAPSVFTSGMQFTISVCSDNGVSMRGTSYSSLQGGYNSAMTNDVINARAEVFSGLTCDSLNNPAAPYVTINGGLDCGFTNQIGLSYIDGPVSISTGTVAINGIAIK